MDTVFSIRHRFLEEETENGRGEKMEIRRRKNLK